jgi:hypothetical protein
MSVALQKFVIDYRSFAQHFKQLGNDALLPINYLSPTAIAQWNSR